MVSVIMSYGVSGNVKHRYIIKHQGIWKRYDTWAISPDWDDEVTDVIWVKSPDMISNWWQMKDGKRYIKRPSEPVKDEDLVLIMLALEQ
jgi:hypothetical protein